MISRRDSGSGSSPASDGSVCGIRVFERFGPGALSPAGTPSRLPTDPPELDLGAAAMGEPVELKPFDDETGSDFYLCFVDALRILLSDSLDPESDDFVLSLLNEIACSRERPRFFYRALDELVSGDYESAYMEQALNAARAAEAMSRILKKEAIRHPSFYVDLDVYAIYAAQYQKMLRSFCASELSNASDLHGEVKVLLYCYDEHHRKKQKDFEAPEQEANIEWLEAVLRQVLKITIKVVEPPQLELTEQERRALAVLRVLEDDLGLGGHGIFKKKVKKVKKKPKAETAPNSPYGGQPTVGDLQRHNAHYGQFNNIKFTS